MKLKLLAAAVLAGTVLTVTSCSNEDVPGAENDGLTVFSVKLPEGVGTRAFGDTPTKQQLNVAIYEAGKKDKALFTSINGETTEGLTVNQFGDGLTATVQVALVKNKQYDLVLWAQDAATHPYSYEVTSQELTVTYTDMANFDESRDAFFASKTITSGAAANSETIQLKRMFAQVNVGTNDLTAYTNAGGIDGFGISVSGVANTINLMDGTVSNPTKTVTAATSNMPASDETFPEISGYTGNNLQYLGMAYVLVGDASGNNRTTVNVTLSANGNANFAEYNSVPVQMNYRTNIYGALLTNPEVFNVVIDPIFDGNINHEIKFAATTEEFVSALENAKDGDVIRPTNNMSLAASGNLTVNSDITIDVPEGVTVTTARTNDQANIIVAAGKTLNLTGEGTFSGDNRIVDTNGTLIVDGPTFDTTSKKMGSSITVNSGGYLHFKSGTVNSPYMGIWITGKADIDNGTFNFTSTNKNGDWAYAIQANEGSELVINGGNYSGIQGIVTANRGGHIVINGGFFRTYNSDSESKDGFYCVYSTDNSEVYINGGYFYGANNWNSITEGLSCVVSGDNDVNMPLGSIRVSGGYFSGKPYYLKTPNPVLAPVDGEYVSCDVVKNGLTFKWTVGK